MNPIKQRIQGAGCLETIYDLDKNIKTTKLKLEVQKLTKDQFVKAMKLKPNFEQDGKKTYLIIAEKVEDDFQ